MSAPRVGLVVRVPGIAVWWHIDVRASGEQVVLERWTGSGSHLLQHQC